MRAPSFRACRELMPPLARLGWEGRAGPVGWRPRLPHAAPVAAGGRFLRGVCVAVGGGPGRQAFRGGRKVAPPQAFCASSHREAAKSNSRGRKPTETGVK